jgi:hypothetical protein
MATRTPFNLPERDDEDERATAEEGMTVELDEEDALEVEDTEDGGAIVRERRNLADERRQQDHFANLADEVDQLELGRVVSELLDKIERDKTAG